MLVLLLLCHDDVMVLLLQTLELRGVLDLLGVRHTVGSVDTLPPSREQLMAAFNTLHRSADSHVIIEWVVTGKCTFVVRICCVKWT